MENFTYQNPTKLIFGRGTVDVLGQELDSYGQRVLLVYGGGSIKKSGLYDRVLQQLNAYEKHVIELPGVEPNPRLSSVQKGIDLSKKEKVDVVLAVGGGSVIDCAKTIAAGALYDGDVWDFVTKKAKPQKALPLGCVLTLAATGSEMNPGAVITNWETKENPETSRSNDCIFLLACPRS